MPETYEPIATHTLSSSASQYIFSSIPTTYTDLVLVINAKHTSWEVFSIGFNGDTANNYSWTYILGTGSGVETYRYTNTGSLNLGLRENGITTNIFHIMNYKNTSVFKSVLARANAVSNQVRAHVGLWRSTNAINSIRIATGGTFSTGTMFTLYGIKEA